MSKPGTDTPKTNAARLLDRLQIPYTLLPYQVDLSDLSAPTVARKIGLPLEQVWKTLLCRLEPTGGYAFAVLAGSDALDLKKFARAAGARSASLAALKDVEPLTGYVRGGVTVLAARKPFPAIADETVQLHDHISVSAGQRGLQIVLTPADYLHATAAAVADIISNGIVSSQGAAGE